ncbi:MAG TPA: hypothetical protein VFJ30_18930, partial [Phycisphaerae bacterium]|nr:hypothetical protein [Phycisphaerae bacterium]
MKLLMILAVVLLAQLLAAGCTGSPGAIPASALIAATRPAASTGLRKFIIADYFPYHRTREHDGATGSWRQTRLAAESKAATTFFNYNPDLLDPAGLPQIAAKVRPLVGMQSDLDPDYQEFQILQAKTAGIEGFVIEWAIPGRNGADDLARSLRKTAAKYDFKIGINFIENSHFDWYPGGVDPTCDTREKLAEALKKSHQYLLDTYYSRDTALLVDGHALLLLFCGTTPQELAACKVHPYNLPPSVKDYWYVRRAGIGPNENATRYAYRQFAHLLAGSYAWVVGRYRLSGKELPKDLTDFDCYIDSDDMVAYQKQAAAMNDEYVTRGQYQIRMSSVCPGFDNRGCAGWGRELWQMPREGGATHRRQWEVIVANRDRIDAVLAVTWNDYTEATCVEPTVEHGFGDVEMIARYGAAFKGVQPDLAGIRLPERLFRLRKKAQFLARTGLDVARLTAGLDQAGLHVSRGEYPRAEAVLVAAERAVATMDKQVTTAHFAASVPGPQVAVAFSAAPADPAGGVYDTSVKGL